MGGPPAIGDVNGDGKVEIAVAGMTKIVVINSDGIVRWSQTMTDAASGNAFTGVTMADLDGDGAAEMIFADSNNLHILRGATGRYQAWHRASTLACGLDDRSSCPRTSPGQLTVTEVANIKDMVLAPENRLWQLL
jgi:hypothetical protein